MKFFTIDENCKEFENTDSTKKEQSEDEDSTRETRKINIINHQSKDGDKSSGAKSFSESDEEEKKMNNPIFEFKVLGKNKHIDTCKFPEDTNVINT